MPIGTEWLDDPSRALRAAGWSANRVCPELGRYRALLAAAGYPVPPPAVDFLAAYGGLAVPFRYAVTTRGGTSAYLDELRFDLDDCLDALEPAGRRDLTERLGAPFCPVGAWRSEMAALVMTGDGAVFSWGLGELLRCGPTGDAAVANIIAGSGLARWPEEDPW
ncbi:MAG TPA: SUKH-3 domain-containing protein [Herpetosiphonaceae bacterium]